MKYIISVISIFIGLTLIAETSSSNFLAKIESNLKSELEKKNITDINRAELYIKAARDLIIIKEYKRAEEIYLKVLTIKSKSEMKSEAYNNLLLISQRNNDNNIKELFKKAKTFWVTDNSSASKKLLSYWEEAIYGTTETFKNYKGIHQQAVKKKNVIELIKEGNYKEALSFLEIRSIEQGPYVSKVLVDLLGTVVHKKTEKILCKKKYLKKPKSNNYLFLTCKAIIQYQQSKLLSDEDLNFIEKRTKRSDKKRLYWIKIIKNLQT